jgi:transcription elongation factor Elf1
MIKRKEIAEVERIAWECPACSHYNVQQEKLPIITYVSCDECAEQHEIEG